jgi:Ca2+-transporting ATPase
VILSYLIGRKMGGVDTGKTMAFVTLAVAELWQAFSFRSSTRNVWQHSLFSNMYLIWAVLSSAAIVAATVLIGLLRGVFGNTSLNANEWLIAIVLSLLPFVAVEVWTFIRRTLSAATVT